MSENSVVIERTLDASIDMVWSMWTEAANFQKWYGPMGATIPVAEMDVTVGGKRKICMEMQTPNGLMQMWMVGEYKEITPKTRLVYTEAMADADGNIMSPAAMGMDQPDITDVIVELEDLGGSTKMTMTHAGIPAGSPGEMGWNMALDKMAGVLAG